MESSIFVASCSQDVVLGELAWGNLGLFIWFQIKLSNELFLPRLYQYTTQG